MCVKASQTLVLGERKNSLSFDWSEDRCRSLVFSGHCCDRTWRWNLLVAPELEAEAEGHRPNCPHSKSVQCWCPTSGASKLCHHNQLPPSRHTYRPCRKGNLRERCFSCPSPQPHTGAKREYRPLKANENQKIH